MAINTSIIENVICKYPYLAETRKKENKRVFLFLSSKRALCLYSDIAVERGLFIDDMLDEFDESDCIPFFGEITLSNVR